MSPGARGDREFSPAVEMEGYLIAHTHREHARREAEDLCSRMPWLTTAQAEDLTRQYVLLRIGLTRRMLQDSTGHTARLREEYEARYRTLRGALLRRHAAAACVTLAGAAGVATLLSMAGR